MIEVNIVVSHKEADNIIIPTKLYCLPKTGESIAFPDGATFEVKEIVHWIDCEEKPSIYIDCLSELYYDSLQEEE